MTGAARYPAWIGAIPPVLLIALWQYQASRGLLPRYLPAPSAVLAQTGAMLASGELLRHVAISLYRALAGFVIGGGCGIAAGLLSAASRPIERFYEPLISLSYPVPKIAALPIIFAWFGLGNLSKIVIITVSVFYPLYITAFAGARATSRVHLWSARNMGASPARIVLKVLLPSAMPQIVNGLRIGLALSFVVMFVAEMIASSEGLGHLIVFADENLRFDIMYVAILAIGVLGFIADRLLLVASRRLLVGQFAAREARR